MIKRGEALRVWLARPAMLALWSLVFWGTLLAAITAVDAAVEGGSVVWQRLWPQRGASVWAWLNLASIALAAVAWPAVGTLLVRSRREHRAESPPEE